MAKRGYSREFKVRGDTGKRYLLDDIPADLWLKVRAKCKAEGISVRAALLKLLTLWTIGTIELYDPALPAARPDATRRK